MDLRIGFFASDGSYIIKTLMKDILDGTLQANPRVLISSKPDSGSLEYARKCGLPAYSFSGLSLDNADEAVMQILREHDVNLLVLAGFIPKLSPRIVAAYPKRVLSIHPSLLPKYGGKGMFGSNVHEAVLQAREKKTGVTVHLVDEEYDSGAIIAQQSIRIFPDDTVETLSDRVLKIGSVFYSRVLQDIANGKIDLDKF